MSKYKPEINDKIKFTRDSNIHKGSIRWIASSGFILVMDHDVQIKGTNGLMEGCDIFIDSSDVIGKQDDRP